MGNTIKNLRKKIGLTQPELAELLNISFSTLRRWEVYGGQPRVDEIKKLCEVLQCTEAELLNDSQSQDWNIKIKISKGNEVNTAMDLTSTATAAILDLGDVAMGITFESRL